MGQPIGMGPFTFSVTSASQGKQWESAEGTFREIDVRVRVERDSSAPFTVNFSSFFLDKLHIIDAAIGTRPRDFRLIVTHPDPAGDEPRRAAVQLE
jgi:hypothetical protein